MSNILHISMAGEVPLSHESTAAALTPPKLFVGSLSAAESSSFLHNHKISHILTVATRLSVNIPENVDVQHKIVECIDHPMASILEVLPECLHFIKTALDSRGCVLVHCASGVSRSVAVCTAFLMIEYKIEMCKALMCITKVRKFANPNLGFRRQLEVLEKCKGDIKTAQVLYSEETSNVVEDTIQQRGLVNMLHQEVDDVEGVIASMKSNNETSFLSTKNTLVRLQKELNSCLPALGNGFVDPPARMIQKAAITKTERLMELLQ